MNHKDMACGFALFGGTLTAYMLLYALVFHLYTDQLKKNEQNHHGIVTLQTIGQK